MLIIPLAAVPSQTLAITLGTQPVQVELRTLETSLYFSLLLNEEPIVTNRVCRNRQRLLLDAQYRGFQGDFAFVDTQGDTDPAYLGLATRYQLVYFDDGE